MPNDSSEARPRANRWLLIRYGAGLAAGVLVLVILFSQRDDLTAAWHQLSHLNRAWAFGAVASEFASIAIYSHLQQRVLAVAGTTIALAPLLAISLATNAVALTVPGEPAVSSAFRYRQYRRRGASGAVAGWVILTIIIAQAVGLSLLLLVGVLISLSTGAHGDLTGASLIGLGVVLAAGMLLVRRNLLLRFFSALVRAARRLTGHPKGNVGERVTNVLQNMHEFKLSVATTVRVVALATLMWSCDFGCLLCAFAAVHAAVPRDGVLLAYGVAQIVAVLPIVPGGLGLVEGSLAVILVAYGATRVPALSTVLVYRFVSYWLAISVGWFTFACLMYGARRAKGRLASTLETSVPLDADPAT